MARPVVRVHLNSPWRAHLADHAGHCIRHHRQQATDYLFAELPGFKKQAVSPRPSRRCAGLLLGTEIGHNGWQVVAWCLGLTVLGYLWSTSLFNRDPK